MKRVQVNDRCDERFQCWTAYAVDSPVTVVTELHTYRIFKLFGSTAFFLNIEIDFSARLQLLQGEKARLCLIIHVPSRSGARRLYDVFLCHHCPQTVQLCHRRPRPGIKNPHLYSLNSPSRGRTSEPLLGPHTVTASSPPPARRRPDETLPVVVLTLQQILGWLDSGRNYPTSAPRSGVAASILGYWRPFSRRRRLSKFAKTPKVISWQD